MLENKESREHIKFYNSEWSSFWLLRILSRSNSPGKHERASDMVGRPACAALHLLSAVEHYVFVSFVHFDLVEHARLWQLAEKSFPDEDCHVFSGAHHVFEVRHVFVQVFVVHCVHYRDLIEQNNTQKQST